MAQGRIKQGDLGFVGLILAPGLGGSCERDYDVFHGP